MRVTFSVRVSYKFGAKTFSDKPVESLFISDVKSDLDKGFPNMMTVGRAGCAVNVGTYNGQYISSNQGRFKILNDTFVYENVARSNLVVVPGSDEKRKSCTSRDLIAGDSIIFYNTVNDKLIEVAKIDMIQVLKN